jgi:signal transduction histidine kinase
VQRETELAKVVAAQVGRELTGSTKALSRLGQALSFPELDATALDDLGSSGAFGLEVFDGGVAVYNPTGALFWSYPPDGSVLRQLETIRRELQTVYSDVFRDPRTDELAIEFALPILTEQGGLQAVVEERSRVARDLHDSVSQSLYSVTLFAEAARRHLDTPNSKRTADSLDQLIEAAQQALQEMRLMVYEMRPSELAQQGLIGALKQRLNTVEKRAGIDAEIDAPASLDLSEILEQDLYSIAREALNNALKHANARTVTVRVRNRGDALELEVWDDGDGFDPSTVHVRGGVGLCGMKERAEKLGGHLVVQSVPKQGTLVRVRIQTEARGRL